MPYLHVISINFSTTGLSPVKVLGHVDGGNRESEDASLAVALHHDVAEGHVKHIHFLLEFAVRFLHLLTADHNALLFQRAGRDDVKGQIGKRALKADSGGHIEIKYKFLQCLLNGFVIHIVIAYKRGAVCVKGRPRLGAGAFALRRKRRIDDLAQKSAEMLGGLGLNLAGYAAEAELQKLHQIPAGAVGAEKAQVVDMYLAGQMRLADFIRIDLVQPVAFRKGFANIVVKTVNRLLRVGVFIDLPVPVI